MASPDSSVTQFDLAADRADTRNRPKGLTSSAGSSIKSPTDAANNSANIIQANRRVGTKPLNE